MKTFLHVSLFGAFVALLLAVSFYTGLDGAAKLALHQRKSQDTTIMFVPVRIAYTSTERVNVAEATGLGMTARKFDYNKTRIVGEFLGNRTKEVAKGFFRGIFSENKH